MSRENYPSAISLMIVILLGLALVACLGPKETPITVREPAQGT
jgi:hypothetical protein